MESPKSDELLDRHKFYAVVAERFNVMLADKAAGDSTRSRIHQRVDEVEGLTKKNAARLTEIDTQKNTIRYAVGIAWIAFGGLGGWAFDKTTTKLEQYVTLIDEQKKEIDTLKREMTALQGTAEKVDALTRVTTAHTADINSIKYKDK